MNNGAPADGWWWARRDTRWDVYPQQQPLERVRVQRAWGQLVDLFHEDGSKVRVGYILDRPVEK
jgi:hypothetical protein